MLKKLIKYDYKAVLKYWWIAALSSLAFAFVGGGCITILNSEKELTGNALVLATLGMVLVIISFVAFILLSEIFIFLRFYKNLFTDEGYLTFTLPVKRSSILSSKLIVSITTMMATFITLIVDVGIMLVIGFRNDIFTPEFAKEISDALAMISKHVGIPYAILYIFEGMVAFTLSMMASVLFLFVCISIASVITKKAKIITAIAIYYGANGIITFVLQLFFLFGIPAASEWVSEINKTTLLPFIGVSAFVIILLISIFCTILYGIQYWLLDRKLNLN